MTSFLTPTSTKIKIVLDTNQFLSGFLYHGMIKAVFDLVFDNKLKLYISPLLKAEVLKKLQEFNVRKQTQSEAIFFIDMRGILVEPMVKVTACRDRKDNFALELAETANAHYLITRDKDLLELPNSRWKHTIIIKPEDFLPLLRKMRILSKS